MTFSGYIKLVNNDCIVDKKVYCSREDREEIINRWGNYHSNIFHKCFIQITPSLSQYESRICMNKADKEKRLKNLQKECKERYGIIEPAKKVDFTKLRQYVGDVKEEIKRPEAKYDNRPIYNYDK